MINVDEKIAFDTLDWYVDQYVDNWHCGNGLADKEQEEQLIGMVRGAYIFGIISDDRRDYYVRCLRQKIYVGD